MLYFSSAIVDGRIIFQVGAPDRQINCACKSTLSKTHSKTFITADMASYTIFYALLLLRYNSITSYYLCILFVHRIERPHAKAM